MYVCKNGEITERFPDQWLILSPVSIETIPFMHFKPGVKAFQVSTIGCNFSCPGCVSEVLLSSPDEISTGLIQKSPEEIIAIAKDQGCKGIAFCMNEPVVSLHSFLRLARVAKENGLFVTCSSNGYWTPETADLLCPMLDAVNLGIKGLSDDVYRSVGAESHNPVYETLKRLIAEHIHVEVALIHITGMESEVLSVVRKIVSISPDIPIQIMRCIAFEKLTTESEPSIPESEALCAEIRKINPHVYLFNSPGTRYLNTHCPDCGRDIIHREMFGPMGSRIIDDFVTDTCVCGYKLKLIPPLINTRFEDKGMNGGYRLTRGMEMIYGILTCIGGDDGRIVSRLWYSLIANGEIGLLHEKLHDINPYCELVHLVAGLAGREEAGNVLVQYLMDKVHSVKEKTDNLKRPSVYYSTGYPHFALNPNGFHSKLVETAGGVSVNNSLTRTGGPGINLHPDEIQMINPDWIFISGIFNSMPVDDYMSYCRNHSFAVNAVNQGHVVQIPPAWDFASPRWVLGLMIIANHLHPDRCNYNIEEEAEQFYQRFYGISYGSISPTRSFFRPTGKSR